MVSGSTRQGASGDSRDVVVMSPKNLGLAKEGPGWPKGPYCSFPGVLGNTFVLLKCHPDPLCHTSPRAGGTVQPGNGVWSRFCAQGSLCCPGCWCHPWDTLL